MLGCGAFLAYSLSTVDAMAAMDGARWRLGQEAVRAGVPARFVDAGWEWFAFHQDDAVLHPTFESDAFWLAWFDSPACRQVSTARSGSAAPLADATIDTPLWGELRLFLQQGPRPCPTPMPDG